jgi:hypothetical protein
MKPHHLVHPRPLFLLFQSLLLLLFIFLLPPSYLLSTLLPLVLIRLHPTLLFFLLPFPLTLTLIHHRFPPAIHLIPPLPKPPSDHLLL